jgi:hypothetical protein
MAAPVDWWTRGASIASVLTLIMAVSIYVRVGRAGPPAPSGDIIQSRQRRRPTLMEYLEAGAHLVAIVGLFFVWRQIRDGVEATRDDRSADWVSHLTQPDTWQAMWVTYSYFSPTTRTSQQKLRRIHEDGVFRSDFYRTMGELELLGYMYNQGKIDREIVRQGPIGLLTDYSDAAKFWVDTMRAITHDSTYYRQFELMVKDLNQPRPTGH